MSFRRNKRVPKFDYYTKVHDKYCDHLVELLKEPFYQRIKEICESVKAKNNTKTIKSFQAEMKNVKKWDYEDLKKSAKFVVHKSGASQYVPKLIKATIISGIKLLTATSSRKKVDSIETNSPETITFFSKCFINIGRSFYMEPYLICDAGQQPGQRLINITDSIDLIEKAIKKSIDSFLPYDEILDIYLANVEDDDTSDEEPEVESEQEESESDIESETESDNDIESDIESDNDNEMPREASDDDVMSVHSEKSEHTDKIKENDFSQDETLDIAEVAPQSVDTIDIIGDDIEDAFNFVPTMSDTEADSSMPTPQPQPQQVKIVAVNQPVPQSAPAPAQKKSSNSDVKQIIFAPGAMDLTDM